MAKIDKRPKKIKIPLAQIADTLVANGISPETFSVDYDYQQVTRNTISFKPATLRDFQIGDFADFIDGQSGLIIGINSFPVFNAVAQIPHDVYGIFDKKRRCYSGSGNNVAQMASFDLDDISEHNKSYQYMHNSADLDKETELLVAVFTLPKCQKSNSFDELCAYWKKTNNKVKYIIAHYKCCEVIKIYKNAQQLLNKYLNDKSLVIDTEQFIEYENIVQDIKQEIKRIEDHEGMSLYLKFNQEMWWQLYQLSLTNSDNKYYYGKEISECDKLSLEGILKEDAINKGNYRDTRELLMMYWVDAIASLNGMARYLKYIKERELKFAKINRRLSRVGLIKETFENIKSSSE